MTDAELDALDAKLASQIGDDIQVIFNHEYLFKQSRAAISELRAIPTIDPAAIRDAALREAMRVVRDEIDLARTACKTTAKVLAIIHGNIYALIGEKK